MCVCLCVCVRSEEHTSELQSHLNLVCRLLLEKKTHNTQTQPPYHTDTLTHQQPHTHTETHHHQHTHNNTPPHDKHAHTHYFFFNDTATTEIYTLSLHDALPI